MTTYWSSIPDWDISLERSIGTVRLGNGVDLSNPESPIPRNIVPFKKADGALPPPARDKIVDRVKSTSYAEYLSTTSEYEEAMVLNAYFKASSGFIPLRSHLPDRKSPFSVRFRLEVSQASRS